MLIDESIRTPEQLAKLKEHGGIVATALSARIGVIFRCTHHDDASLIVHAPVILGGGSPQAWEALTK
jgi:hypothetical protein